MGIKADSIDGLTALSEKLTGMGLKDLVIDPGSREPKQSNEDMIAIRRAALKNANRAVGFPTIAFPCEMASNLDTETMLGAMYVAKYGGIVVMSDFAGESLFPLLLEAQYDNGGWPQYHPRATGYHKHITFNDNI